MLIHIANFTCKPSLKSQTISQIHVMYNFKGAQPDHVRVQSASCCFPRELVSFICPRELERFNAFELGGVTIAVNMLSDKIFNFPSISESSPWV